MKYTPLSHLWQSFMNPSPPEPVHTDALGRRLRKGDPVLWSSGLRAGFIRATVQAVTPKKVRLDNGSVVEPSNLVLAR